MKKTIFLAIVMAFVLVSCVQKNKEAATESHSKHQDTTMTDNDTNVHNQAAAVDEHAALYACPMHPEVQGKKEDKCPKCGMKLTEPVTEKADEE
ncbi:heavy metal-binding domain-containing protein [Flavobacterium sp. J49]|uniref:heavy metal-binding domain-containing protein n=1 Tax=Flavobacterium sp. J49 TaxID=2718534 RepID=UPI001C3DB619|nr:heavy metal-binding domain-containing protein [Flavobacterium sp. J49]